MTFGLLYNREQVRTLAMERLVSETGYRIGSMFPRLLFGTQMISHQIHYGGGELPDFEYLASIIVEDQAVVAVMLAPGGVVSEVYPRDIGLGLGPEITGRTGISAMQWGTFVLGGPFRTGDGSDFLVGSLPVFLDGTDGEEPAFWGTVCMVLDYGRALNDVGIGDLAILDFGYEIWQRDTDSGIDQLIFANNSQGFAGKNYVDRTISLYNVEWHLRIFGSRVWYADAQAWIAVFISLILSLMVAALVRNTFRLERRNRTLRKKSITDPLTGLHNRRYFMAATGIQMERVTRNHSESFLMMMDMDHFKEINDNYGHLLGDAVLKNVAERITATLRPYDIFARYGGEEFILFVADMNRTAAVHLAERIRRDVSGTPITLNDRSINVTISIGITKAAPQHGLEEAIALADKVMYQAKERGRNQAVFQD